MRNRIGETRWTWLVCGVLIGLGVSYFWPHEPIRADQSDRNDKFGLLTAPATTAIMGLAGSEAVFVLDFLTGRLQGFYFNPTANPPRFTQAYFRDVARDFGTDKKGVQQPTYAFVAGQSQVVGQGTTYGASVIYVAELNSGQIVAYGFPYTQANVQQPPMEMVPLDHAEFRAAVAQ